MPAKDDLNEHFDVNRRLPLASLVRYHREQWQNTHRTFWKWPVKAQNTGTKNYRRRSLRS
jgi:hypothetical protein